MRNRTIVVVAAGFAAAAALAPVPSTAAPVATTLVYATSASRTAPLSLSGATVSGSIYAFTTPDSTTTTKVLFYVDDPNRLRAAYRQENTAPYDLAGGTATVASPYATSALADGSHTLTAAVYDSGGTVQVVTATFAVANGPVAPQPAYDQVHLAWPGDPATTFTALWTTGHAATLPQLRFRLAGTSVWTIVTGALKPSGSAGSLRQATASGLTPDASYEYQVLGDGGVWSTSSTTRTIGVGSPFTFAYEADTGVAGRLDGLATGTLAVRDEITALDPQLILGGGDYVSRDTDVRYSTVDQGIDAWFHQEQPIASRAPIMPTYGNHEVLLSEGFRPWADRFATPTGTTGQDGTVGDARGNYSFDAGPVHFVSLESVTESTGEPANVMTWLENDIVAAKARGVAWIVPYMHAGPITNGTNHSVNYAIQAQLGPLFEKYGVQLVISSHDQSFERSYPLVGLKDQRVAQPTATSSSLTCYQDTGRGVVYLKVSPSGKLSNQTNKFSAFASATKPAWTAVRDNTTHHLTYGQVSAAALTMSTYDVTDTGVVTLVDRFTIGKAACSTPPPPPPVTLRVSTQPARSAPVALDGATVTGPVYAFTAPDRPGTLKVLFYVDDPSRLRAAYRQENSAPYDLAGGTVTLANPYATSQLANGKHTLTVAIYPSVGPPDVVTATFTVAN